MADEATSWDHHSADAYGFDPDALEEFIATSTHCFMARLRKDGHPVGAYYGCAYDEGDIYVVSNVFRKAYEAIKRDDRITVVFAKHNIGEVSIIGRGEIIDDYELVRKFFLKMAPNNFRVVSGDWTVDQFMKMACTKNRRLIKVHRERVFSAEMAKLPFSDDDE
jgi:uncharacterized pyridoxamine 5'-phosphate oxidase family protein